ncbi:MAG: Imm8 family immunity protein [Bacteroidales bacterium]|jgi:hypothetical protein|nr:Imm8 family immunity protein [Bacteroidales bacterium]
MKLKLKITNFYSVDLPCNKVSKYVPDDEEIIFFQTYFDVVNLESNETCECQVVIATPKGLSVSAKNDNFNLISDRALLVYKKYNYHELMMDIEKIVDSCNKGDDFLSMVGRLERYFSTDYEK